MRENLFHGKRKDNGEWVEGYYVPVGEYHYILTGKLVLASYLVSYLGFEHFLVIPETVGQYAELPDKNGKKIFEGDIVRDAETSEVGKIFFDKYTAMFVIGFENTIADFNASYNLEVIGNIYDNPELIGEKTND